VLSGGDAARDPGLVAGGIAEALYTTAFGLIIAIATLVPAAAFRKLARSHATRLELLAACVDEE
jgi:biopolymer transport protein ExbB/TolQ